MNALKYEKTLDYWRSLRITTAAELSAALNSHRILLAYHSGKLENDRVTYNDVREIFERDGVCRYTGDLRTLFEIRNAKAAYERFLDAFEQRLPLDEELLLDLHRLLTENTYDTRRYSIGERPGNYKLHDYVTGKEEIGAAPEDVKEEMDELLSELKNLPREKALTAAAYFHAKFENIHPFADGNGRTGRLAMNYLLACLDHPLVVIHEEDRDGYYAGLEAWDRDQDLKPLTEYLREQTVKTWSKQVARLEKRTLPRPPHL